nr:DNA cytosine methyltransferase [Mycoplasma simbae]
MRKDIDTGKFWFDLPLANQYNFEDFIDKSNDLELDINNSTFQRYLNNKYTQGKIDLDSILQTNNLVIDTLQSDLRLSNNTLPTLRVGRHDLYNVKNKHIYKLNGVEASKLQCFGEKYTQMYKNSNISFAVIMRQTANVMTVNVIEHIAKILVNCQSTWKYA